jgi:hypothetical protein
VYREQCTVSRYGSPCWCVWTLHFVVSRGSGSDGSDHDSGHVLRGQCPEANPLTISGSSCFVRGLRLVAAVVFSCGLGWKCMYGWFCVACVGSVCMDGYVRVFVWCADVTDSSHTCTVLIFTVDSATSGRRCVTHQFTFLILIMHTTGIKLLSALPPLMYAHAQHTFLYV